MEAQRGRIDFEEPKKWRLERSQALELFNDPQPKLTPRKNALFFAFSCDGFFDESIAFSLLAGLLSRR
jgi:hypothetical protein